MEMRPMVSRAPTPCLKRRLYWRAAQTRCCRFRSFRRLPIGCRDGRGHQSSETRLSRLVLPPSSPPNPRSISTPLGWTWICVRLLSSL
ncbi:hypothetical protein FA13DRAFT_614135 [Coprinellus micaceus]|uniref:Uncharacterized protein n=1 Tax=Coprinellus micaceus TaxID=71717 RepID=A0A4Y7SA78_COPMI|nr:hypothetical protein FA13DRAFT_614135 [Coprinellus micaceus]